MKNRLEQEFGDQFLLFNAAFLVQTLHDVQINTWKSGWCASGV